MLLLPLSVAVPLLLAVIAPWLIRRFGSRVCVPLALVPLGLGVALVAAWAQAPSNELPAFFAPWASALGLDWGFRLDGLALLFSGLILGIGTLVLLYCSGYFGKKPVLGAEVVGWLLAFLAAMLGIVIADNLLLLFVFWELTSISSFMLIGVTRTPEARAAAKCALLTTVLGGLAMLAGFVLMGMAYETYSISAMVEAGPMGATHPEFYVAAFVLVLIGAVTKSAQFPFHFWLPGAMAAPTPVSAYLHSATMVKAGVFLLARLNPVLGGTEWWLIGVTAFGAATVLVAFITLPRLADLKQILAYSTVISLGAMTLLLGLAEPTGGLSIIAALVFLLAHALYKSALFLSAGSVDHGSGTRDVWQLRGLRRTMPVTAALAAVAALSMAGVAPFLGFVAKEKALLVALEAELGVWWYGLMLTMVVTALAAVYVAVRVAWTPYFGRTNEVAEKAHESPRTMLIAMAVPALLGLAAGFLLPFVGAQIIAPAAHSVAGMPLETKLELWHGFTPELFIGLGALVLGVLFAAVAPALARFLPKRPLAQQGYDASLAGMLALGGWLTRTIQNGNLRVYMIVVLLFFVAAILASSLTFALEVQIPYHVEPNEVGIVVAALIAIGAVGTALARSRLVAIFGLGLTGLGLSLLFLLYAAPDLALTLLVVEVLTVVLLVLAFQRLPDYVRSRTPGRTAVAGVVAVAVGVAVTLLVFSALSDPRLGEISETYAKLSVPEGEGRNVVNVILVDFRALDTLGEIVVLAIAAVGMMALVRRGRRALRHPMAQHSGVHPVPRSQRQPGTATSEGKEGADALDHS